MAAAALATALGTAHADWGDPPASALGRADSAGNDAGPGRSPAVFRAELAVVGDEMALRRDFRLSTEAPMLPRLSAVHRGSEVSAVVLLRDCRLGQAGVCDVSVEFSIVTPSGTSLAGGNGSLWARDVLPGYFVLGSASMAFAFGAGDPAGVYLVKAKVTDRVASRTLELTLSLEVEG